MTVAREVGEVEIGTQTVVRRKLSVSARRNEVEHCGLNRCEIATGAESPYASVQ